LLAVGKLVGDFRVGAFPGWNGIAFALLLSFSSSVLGCGQVLHRARKKQRENYRTAE
jgi:hypothetical protein